METLGWIQPSVTSGGMGSGARMLSSHWQGDQTADAPDGINNHLRPFSATWEDLPVGQADILIQFLRGQVGKTFLWAMPREITPRRWRALDWTRTYPYSDADTVSVTFQEVATT